MSSWRAARMFFTISCTRVFASGGKTFSTYFLPKASPSRLSSDSAQRFLRGSISLSCVRSGKMEDCCDVLEILLAGLLRLLVVFEVVVAVRQTEPRGFEVGDHICRFVPVRI